MSTPLLFTLAEGLMAMALQVKVDEADVSSVKIGIPRLAIGALEDELLLQFLIKAVLLSACGGMIGIALVVIACIGLSTILGSPFLFNSESK